MYISKPEIEALNVALEIIEREIKSNEHARDQNKKTYFLLVGIKDRAIINRDKTLAYQKETRFLRTQPVVRNCCVCGYHRSADLMRPITNDEWNQGVGRADQWICTGAHRLPYKVKVKNKLGRPRKT